MAVVAEWLAVSDAVVTAKNLRHPVIELDGVAATEKRGEADESAAAGAECAVVTAEDARAPALVACEIHSQVFHLLWEFHDVLTPVVIIRRVYRAQDGSGRMDSHLSNSLWAGRDRAHLGK
jgi:hypothetical protein